MGNFIARDARTGKIVWTNKEQFSVWSGVLATAGNVVFYGTLEGSLKAADAKTGKELFKLKLRPASSETSTPTSTTASSMLLSYPEWVVGLASALLPD
jgi:glucose dehydrogenase